MGTPCAQAGIALEELGKTIDEHHATVLWGCVFEDFLAAELDDGRNIVDDYLKRRGYRGLLSERIPALGNVTPRTAARTEKGRKKLAAWLKTIENGCAHHPPGPPMAGYDIGWMWEELGVSDLRR